jgi:hypothetical protein
MKIEISKNFAKSNKYLELVTLWMSIFSIILLIYIINLYY